MEFISRRSCSLVGATRILALLLPILWFALATFGVGGAHAYRFYSERRYGGGSLLPTSGPALRWDPDVWGPRETLPWVLVHSEALDAMFSDVTEAKAFIEEEALETWSNIPTADIRWKIDRIASEDEDLDSRTTNSVRLGSSSFAGTAAIRTENDLIVGCRIVIWDGETDRRRVRSTLVHEFGHCLGLRHAGLYVNRTWSPDFDAYLDLPPYWREQPIMSYGARPETLEFTTDDQTGASLLRPRGDWIQDTGTLWGRVFVDDGDRAKHVHILVTRRDEDGNMVESVGRFTNRHGDFAIGGLDPGHYVVLVRPIVHRVAQQSLLAFATMDIRDSLRAMPVRVEAGARTGPIFLTVRRGKR